MGHKTSKVHKSGISKNKNKLTQTTINIAKNHSKLFRVLFFLTNHQLKNNINASLTNSQGWIDQNQGKCNHHLAPLSSIHNGVNIKSKNNKVHINIFHLLFLIKSSGTKYTIVQIIIATIRCLNCLKK